MKKLTMCFSTWKRKQNNLQHLKPAILFSPDDWFLFIEKKKGWKIVSMHHHYLRSKVYSKTSNNNLIIIFSDGRQPEILCGFFGDLVTYGQSDLNRTL